MPPRRGAHPRSRGEHFSAPAIQGIKKGSSPLARGTRKPEHSDSPPLGSSPLARGTPTMLMTISSTTGLIPARAGNTLSPVLDEVAGGAHPRSRGEHLLHLAHHHSNVGSSPLARGTHRRRVHDSAEAGLIPARAGNTASCAVKSLAVRAHPRSRGEHSMTGRIRCGCWGSSPLARGTLSKAKVARDFGGLIPARAGNTSLPR